MKRFITTYDDRMIKLEGLLFIDRIREKYPTEVTLNTKFDEEGKVLPFFTFDIVYENGSVVSPLYDEIDEAEQDKKFLEDELNKV